jgi:Zn-finger nucleic acid-binding protein
MATCNSCGAPLRIDGDRGILLCEHCGRQQAAPADLERIELLGHASHLCPTCSTPLSTARIEGQPLLCCERCFGMLIEMNVFTAVIDAVRAHEGRAFEKALPRHQRPGDRSINCPTCEQPMLSHVYGGPGNVVIDTCERCFVNWLDPGELRRIALAPDRPAQSADTTEADTGSFADREEDSDDL